MSPWNPQAHLGNCDFHVDQYSWECTCGVFDRISAAAEQARVDPGEDLTGLTDEELLAKLFGRKPAKPEPIDWWAKVKMHRLMKKIGIIR